MNKFKLSQTPDSTEFVVSTAEGEEVNRFPVGEVLAHFKGDMVQLLSAFDYSDRLGLPMGVRGSAADFGEMMHQSVLYDRGRTSDDDRLDD